MQVVECHKCHKPLTAEERLLCAIFGDEPTCYGCNEQLHEPTCKDCGKHATVYVENEPYCSMCAGKIYA